MGQTEITWLRAGYCIASDCVPMELKGPALWCCPVGNVRLLHPQRGLWGKAAGGKHSQSQQGLYGRVSVWLNLSIWKRFEQGILDEE